MKDIILADEAYKIIGACFEVYQEKGGGFTEAIYQECLELELQLQDIPFISQPPLPLTYKGRPLKQSFRPDLICFGKVLIELKAVALLTDEHRSQVLNYLNGSGLRLGLLINFGHHPKLEWARLVR